MKRFFRPLILGALLTLVASGIAYAALYEQAASGETDACYNLVNSSAGPNACLGETHSSNWPAGDLLILTNGSDIPDLSDIEFGLNGPSNPNKCDDNFLDDWNDCLTDAYVKLPAGTCFRAYTDEAYRGQRVFAASNWAADPGSNTYFYQFQYLSGGLNNTISSIRLYSC